MSRYTTEDWDRAFRVFAGPDAFVSDLDVAVPEDRETVAAIAQAFADQRDFIVDRLRSAYETAERESREEAEEGDAMNAAEYGGAAGAFLWAIKLVEKVD